MQTCVSINNLCIQRVLYDFMAQEVLPHTGISEEYFWSAFEAALEQFGPENKVLLGKRDWFQEQLNSWYAKHQGQPLCPDTHEAFLRSIGYLVDIPEEGHIETATMDPEIALCAAPQLVVPADNARYALNAANARWGSLLDVCYGTDMIDETLYPKAQHYNPERGAKVFAYVYDFLDAHIPLESSSYGVVKAFCLDKGVLRMVLPSGHQVGLKEPQAFVGYTLDAQGALSSILLKHHGLHIQLCLDPQGPIGRTNSAGINDVILESVLSAIIDCEDSVAAVDAEDKVRIYRHWNGMMKGDLEARFENKSKMIHRRLNTDKTFLTPDGKELTLKGRVLLLVRNVGLHMYCDAVRYRGEEIPEGFLDAFVTAACALHDLRKSQGIRNSVTQSVYIVKPKCHGPEEVAFVDALFAHIEKALDMKPYTIKMGIMDEERRTSANLKATILAAKKRVFFINTGFLDRTGDEIHSVMMCGPVLGKEEMKNAPWLKAYEDGNVDTGLALGFSGHAQIGKGMWTMPDAMKRMVEVKIAHPRSGATTAWVPSPTAATLHALHYHRVDVFGLHEDLMQRQKASLESLLTPPLLSHIPSSEAIQKELENNIQSILGYVVRWIDQGIGCSKVPDIDNIALMEDRATLRISSQLLANWLAHGVMTHEVLLNAFYKMASVVDAQNANDSTYRAMAPDYEKSHAFQAALALVLKGTQEPNGYTEFILHRYRRMVKNEQ